MNFKILTVVLLALSTISCSTQWTPDEPDAITKVWHLSDVKVLKTKKKKITSKQTDKLLEEANSKTLLEQGYHLYIFPDGIAGRVINNIYSPGKWELTDGDTKLAMHFGKDAETLSFINMLIEGESSYLITKADEATELDFLQAYDMLEDFKDDPFYPDNNLWRIKPGSEESELQLKKRLKNYVRHSLLILKAAVERKAHIISFEESKGVIKIYRNGIGAKELNKLPKEWKNYFYNEAQSLQCYEIYKQYLANFTYKGAKYASWIEMDYNILLALYKFINEDIEALKANT